MLAELAWLVVKMLILIVLVDLLLLVTIWRVKVLNRKIDDRMRRKQLEKDAENDRWFTDGQKELFSDYY